MPVNLIKRSYGSYALLFVSMFFIACEKTETTPTPKDKLAGSWTLENFTTTENGQPVEHFADKAAFKPCMKENRITFKSGKYTTSLPATCIDEEGELLRIFPQSKSGTYTLTDEGAFELADGSYTFRGLLAMNIDATAFTYSIVNSDTGYSANAVFSKK